MQTDTASRAITAWSVFPCSAMLNALNAHLEYETDFMLSQETPCILADRSLNPKCNGSSTCFFIVYPFTHSFTSLSRCMLTFNSASIQLEHSTDMPKEPNACMLLLSFPRERHKLLRHLILILQIQAILTFRK